MLSYYFMYNDGNTIIEELADTDVSEEDNSVSEEDEEDSGEDNPNACKTAFDNQPANVGCLLWDDANCNTELDPRLFKESSVTIKGTTYINETEAVSVKRGCQLTVYTGNVCQHPSKVVSYM